MTKKPSTQEVEIDIVGGRRALNRTHHVCVVYLGKIGPDEDPLPHMSPLIVGADASITGQLPMLTLEAGASLIPAGLLADHIAAKPEDQLLRHAVESGEIRVFESAEKVLDLPLIDVRTILGQTRHGQVLRAWEAREGAQARPRRAIIDGIKKRLRLFADHAPVEIGSLTGLQDAARATREALAAKAAVA